METLSTHIVMVRPFRFRKNEQTATNNFYQKNISSTDDTTALAQAEFDAFVAVLRQHGVRVTVYQDPGLHDTPDALFPNNWVSFHPGGAAYFYPMYAKNRRLERNTALLDQLTAEGAPYTVKADWSSYEAAAKFLEGTGSMVLDRDNKIAYAALSERTHPEVLKVFCDTLGYTAVSFTANQTVEGRRLPIYHTNVMMSIGPGFALVCLDAIDASKERTQLLESLEGSNKEVILLSEPQIEQFAGNALTLQGSNGPILVLSSSGYNALTNTQLTRIQAHAKIVHSPLQVIEQCGGGSARCMMAELF